MLVAMAVLAMMTVLLLQMFSSVNQTWLGGQARVDNFSRARALLDLACEDLKHGVYRDDLAAFPGTNIAFYTLRPGFKTGAADIRDVSLVEYRLQSDGTLQRGDLAISWGDPASEISFGSTNDLPRSTQLTMRDISSGILAFEVLYLSTNGLLQKPPQNSALKGFSVGLAVVDGATMKKLSQAQIAALRAGLSSAASGTNGLRADWENYLATGLDWGAYPKGLASGLKLFERYVPIP